MKLIGEKWAEFVAEKKEVLEGLTTTKENVFAQLKKWSLYKFSIDINESLPDVDTGLLNYFDFKLSFIIKQEEDKYTNQRIAVHFGDEFVPFVEYNPKDFLYVIGSKKDGEDQRIDFDEYLGCNPNDCLILDRTLKEFILSIAPIKF